MDIFLSFFTSRSTNSLKFYFRFYFEFISDDIALTFHSFNFSLEKVRMFDFKPLHCSFGQSSWSKSHSVTSLSLISECFTYIRVNGRQSWDKKITFSKEEKKSSRSLCSRLERMLKEKLCPVTSCTL